MTTDLPGDIDLAALPALPKDTDGPVFREPWQAQAFAMTLKLHEGGLFTWPEWVEIFSAEIAAAGARGDADLGDTYYDHWLAALERIVDAKGIVSRETLSERKDEWAAAVARTPHGEPIVLAASDEETR
jgi:nitrile hydratase accessory protein